MAFSMDEIWAYEGQLLCCPTNTTIPALGLADQKIKGSSYIQGPLNVGDTGFSYPPVATVLIGPRTNGPAGSLGESICGASPSNLSLYVKGNTAIKASLFVTNNVSVGGKIDACGSITAKSTITANGVVTGSDVVTAGGVSLSSRKAFDIQHPTKEGWRLRHVCLEGPTIDVYVRGRVTNSDRIQLPEYWMGLVDPRTITVSLTPVGSHQDVVIKRISDNIIFLQSKGGMPIDCFYHVYGERMDGEKLIAEYTGESPEDYPGDNSAYSVAGFHYDQKS